MPHKTKARASARPLKTRRRTAGRGGMAMFLVGDTPLRDFAVPAGASLAIISSDPDAVKKIERTGKFGAPWKIYSGSRPAAAPQATVDHSAFAPDARSLALLEGVRIARETLRAAGGAYDLKQVKTLLRGISRQAIDKRVREGSLLAVPGPKNRRSFPTLQFKRDGTIVQGLKDVREALPTRDPWTILNFLVHPDDRLAGRKPIDLLKAGEVELVVEAARRITQQGA